MPPDRRVKNWELQELTTLQKRMRAVMSEIADMQARLAYLDRFSTRLPATRCEAAQSFFQMVSMGADLAAGRLVELREALRETTRKQTEAVKAQRLARALADGQARRKG